VRLLLLFSLVLTTGCGATVRGSPLSHRPPDDGRGIYLSTGGAPRGTDQGADLPASPAQRAQQGDGRSGHRDHR